MPLSTVFLPGPGRALEVWSAVFRRGRVAEEPQTADFEMLEDRPRHGSEAVVVAGPVPLRPQRLFHAEPHLDIEEHFVVRSRPVVLAVHGVSRGVQNIEETHNLLLRAGQACGRADGPDICAALRKRPV